ncbi:hypothetical protein QEN19_002994 [Hanseniaspora menglaensis]
MNNYTENYIQTNESPQKYIRNKENTVEGYPKLQKLMDLKEQQLSIYSKKAYGCRMNIDKMTPYLKKWINEYSLNFDVVMIGCLTENQFLYPILRSLPIDKLISKPGFLFIWASSTKINELSRYLNEEIVTKKFRRSEELVFIPVDKDSCFYPGMANGTDESLLDKMQWHCWMCITGTVRRATDGHLIHCNIDTDLILENETPLVSSNSPSTSINEPSTYIKKNNCVPSEIYKIAENFSTATRRLHIIPGRTGMNTPVRLRKGWVIMSPDVMLNNFKPKDYISETKELLNLPEDPEIERLRPKSPIQKHKHKGTSY